MKVYLVGRIAGNCMEQCVAWRKRIVEHYRNRRSRNKIAVGEEFWPGDRLIGLPDLSKMKVQTSVVETDIAKVGYRITADAIELKE